jgi:hypothetical protein
MDLLARDATEERPPAPPRAQAGEPAASAARRERGPAATSDDVAVVLLVKLRPGARAWGWSRVVRGGAGLAGEPGPRFAKALGSADKGFGLRPSLSRQGLIAVFDGERAAEAFVSRSALMADYRGHSEEHLTLMLRATSSRGSWGGQVIAATREAPNQGPVAALTRASIRPWRAWPFWRRSPAAERDLADAAGCRLAVGLGEAPILRQATFSLWDDQAAMDRYARSGAHLAAIRASAAGGFFSESMFVRFVALSVQGRWHGRDHG